MMFLHGETVTVLQAGTVVDPYSKELVEDWTNPTPRLVSGVGVEPRPSSEPVQDSRNAITSGYTLYFPAGDPITGRNRVTVRGATYHVQGDPAVWVSPFTGWDAGVVVQVTRTEG